MEGSLLEKKTHLDNFPHSNGPYNLQSKFDNFTKYEYYEFMMSFLRMKSSYKIRVHDDV